MTKKEKVIGLTAKLNPIAQARVAALPLALSPKQVKKLHKFHLKFLKSIAKMSWKTKVNK